MPFKNVKPFFSPVYFQLSRKQYFQGFFLFIFLVSPLYLLKQKYFHDFSGMQSLDIFVWVSFFLGALWHALSVISSKNVLPPVESEEALYEKGRMALLKGNHELASICFSVLEKMKPQDEDALYQLGKTYSQWGRKKEASACFQRYLQEGKTKWKKEIESLLEEGNL